MADIKISGMVEDTAPTIDDLIPTVNDPGVTPVNRKVALSNLLKIINGLTALTSTVDANDLLAIYDAAGAASKKITIDNLFKGTQDIYIPAAAFGANTTGGATFANKEWATNLQNIGEFQFVDTAAKKASFLWKMPRNWDFGTVTYTVVWRTPAVANNVRFTLRAIAYGDGVALDNASWGIAVAITDTANATANVELETADSAAVTIGNTPSSTKRTILFELQRDPADVGDTLANDAFVLGIELHITINKKAAA